MGTNYLAESIDWKRTADPRHPFAANFEGEKCVIRLNDFPDEHLYTLIVDGEEVEAFDDWSAKWNRPAREKAVSQTAPHKSLARTDIISRLADQTGIPKLKAEQAVDALFHSMKEALSRGDRIELRGFGVFVVKRRKRGVGRNPRTGEEVAIPSGKTIRFKPGKELQARDNGEDVASD